MRWAEGTDHLKAAVSVLGNNTFRKVITFMGYENCLRTTNHVERANRFYRKRAKSQYRNRTRRSITNMMKVDLMIRKSRYQRPRPVKLRRRFPAAQ